MTTDWGRPLELRETPTPGPKGPEVLFQDAAAGTCHSDEHIWDGAARRARPAALLGAPVKCELGVRTWCDACDGSQQVRTLRRLEG